MASNAAYADPDAQMGGGSALYGNQNGGTPPGHQQQHSTMDADLQLHDNLAHLQRSSDMMHSGVSQAQQMGALSAAHHHFQTPPRPTHSPQQMAQTVMSMEDHAMYSDHDGGSRKRSKVSRACDECRRKKIRCDATSENGPEACSSCKRTGARCQFSRQPMKRGPSKGYIKELADRLNSLENQIQNPHAPTSTYEFAGLGDHNLLDAQTPTQLARKRTHSMSEGLQDSYNRTSWASQERGIFTPDPYAHAILTLGDLTTNGHNIRRPSYSDMSLAGNLITGSNEGTIKAYYISIHPILPILSQDAPSLNRLSNCPAKLRESFFQALDCCVRSFSPASLPVTEIGLTQLVQQCQDALNVAQNILSDTDSARQFYNNMVYCQSLVLLAVASDKPGYSASGNTGELLARLASRISQLGINDSEVITKIREQDRDTFDDARRLFWAAVILDRFHASGQNKDILLPLQCGVMPREDLNALGASAYYLSRAADIVGHIVSITRAGKVPTLDAKKSTTSSSETLLLLDGRLSDLKGSLDIANLPNTSLPHLAYQYLRILAARLSVYTASKEILALTKELLNSLINTSIGPLHHIFASLVATSLIDLSDRVETQVDAHATIKEMDDAIATGQIVYRIPNGSGWDTALRNVLHQKKAPTPPATATERTNDTVQPNMAGLQHLAAAAVGEREGGTDARPTSSGGNGSMLTSQDTKHDVSDVMAAASEAAVAQATAAAAQQQLQTASGNSNGGNNYDPSALVKEGFSLT